MAKTEVSTAADLADLALSGNSSAVLPDATAPAAQASGSPAPAATPAASNPAAARPQPATLAELKAIAGDDSAFILSQLEAQATMQQASNAYIAKVKAENAELKTKAATPAPVEAPRKPGLAAGVSALATESAGGSASGDAAIDAFNDAVNAEMDRSKVSKHVAHATVCRNRPDLRQSMLAAHNSAFQKKR